MEILTAPNAHVALPLGLRHLRDRGIQRDSRNGLVHVARGPVTTVYDQPMERVVFWPERDANPFFHLYESMWMLAGRNDLRPLLRYVKEFGRFSDNGHTLHGAYGYRWRKAFAQDQLLPIAQRLARDPEDRRCVLQMWDTSHDLNRDGKDVPCNLTVTFQRDAAGRLDMTVFNRSNDVIWGAYGANSVHFGFLLEYMALLIGCPVGKYWQVSVNYHAYNATMEPLAPFVEKTFSAVYGQPVTIENPYANSTVRWIPMSQKFPLENPVDVMRHLDGRIDELLHLVDGGFVEQPSSHFWQEPFFRSAHQIFRAHDMWRRMTDLDRYDAPLSLLSHGSIATQDWVVAAREWLERRRVKYLRKANGFDA